MCIEIVVKLDQRMNVGLNKNGGSVVIGLWNNLVYFSKYN